MDCRNKRWFSERRAFAGVWRRAGLLRWKSGKLDVYRDEGPRLSTR